MVKYCSRFLPAPEETAATNSVSPKNWHVDMIDFGFWLVFSWLEMVLWIILFGFFQSMIAQLSALHYFTWHCFLSFLQEGLLVAIANKYVSNLWLRYITFNLHTSKPHPKERSILCLNEQRGSWKMGHIEWNKMCKVGKALAYKKVITVIVKENYHHFRTWL